MNILSLFDGISCGQLAINRAGRRKQTTNGYEAKKAVEILLHTSKESQSIDDNDRQINT